MAHFTKEGEVLPTSDACYPFLERKRMFRPQKHKWCQSDVAAMRTSICVVLSISAALIAGTLSTTSFMGQMALGANNCNSDLTVCHGGDGTKGGGGGGLGEIGDGTFTLSGGRGGSFIIDGERISGGGGEHLVLTSDPETLVTSGGGSDAGGGRSVCTIDPNTGGFVCQTTGNP